VTTIRLATSTEARIADPRRRVNDRRVKLLLMAVGLLMAGGRGERMRASGIETAKPLVSVRGATLLERNLFALLRAGLRQLVVSTPAEIPELARFVVERLMPTASSAGARLDLLEEREPLGNVGCAGLLRDRSDDVLVVYADNLTSLDLASVLRRHTGERATLTLAAHAESFRLPYGEMTIADGRVLAYAEKPSRSIPVCSGVAVLAPRALEAIAPEGPTGLVDVATRLISAGESVVAFEHDAPWVDVNDAGQVERAEALVAANAEELELWLDDPAGVVECVVARDGEGIAVEQRGGWLTLPEKAVGSAGGYLLDDHDPVRRANLRFRLLDVGIRDPNGTLRVPASQLRERDDVTPVLRRAAAMAR
jgi:NDP-sugar pyrophosphorylase family protein